MEETVKNCRALSLLFDRGTFTETGAYLKRSRLGEEEGLDREGVVTGYGSVDGMPVFAFMQTVETAGGAMTRAQAEKICRLYDLAAKCGGKVVGIFDCAGAYLEEGSAVLSGYASLFARVNAAKGKIPQIAWIEGKCTGMTAALASSFDFTVRNGETGEYAFTSAFLREQAGNTAAADLTASGTEQAARTVRTLLSFLAGEKEADDALLNRASEGFSPKLTPTEQLALLSDGEVLPLGVEGAKEVTTALVRLAGRTVSVLLVSGRLTAQGAGKAAGFITVCDRLGLPHLTLADSDGLSNEGGDEEEKTAAYAALAVSVCGCRSPMVSAVTGRGCGGVFALLCSHAVGNSLVYALDGAQISVLSPEASAQFACGEERSKGEDLAAITEKWNASHDGLALACREGDVDEVLTPALLRPKLVYALELLMSGGRV